MNKSVMGVIISIVTLTHGLIAAVVFTASDPVELSGTQGKFDFIKVDPVNRRLLACHTGNNSLDVIDLDSSKLIKSIVTGAAQGVAIDEKHSRYFVSTSKPSKLVIIDSRKLESVSEMPLDDPADLVAYNAQSNRVLVCNDKKPVIWIIDPESKKVLATQTFPGGGMEDLSFDPEGKYLWQNLKDTSEVVKFDVSADKIIDRYSTLPAEKPHGLAMVPELGALLVVGGTGKLTLLSLQNGKTLSSCDVAQKVDEISYDPVMHQVYCASGTGVISVVSVENNTLTNVSIIPSSLGAHSIAVDSKTHTVWIVFAKGTQSFFQTFRSK